MARVFLVEHPRAHIDVKKAEKFGQLTYIFALNDRRASVFAVNAFVVDALDRLENASFAPEEDSICIAGSMIPVTMIVSAMLYLYGCISVLLYDSRAGEYVRQEINAQNWVE